MTNHENNAINKTEFNGSSYGPINTGSGAQINYFYMSNGYKLSSFYNLPPKNLLFTGRNDILKDIQKGLEESAIFIINGIPGIGKTQIAKQYAYHSEKKYNKIYWFNVKDKSGLTREYLALASCLNLCLTQDESIVIENIKNFFEVEDKNLIIYDNADEIDLCELKKFFPRKGNEIIVTTKNLNWDLEKIRYKKIDDFMEFEAKEFLLSNSNYRHMEDDDEQNCLILINELMLYPLALEQARAYINTKKISFAKYLCLFKEYRFKLMGKEALDYNKTVVTTFRISFDKIAEKNDRSIELLGLCSFFNNDNIPINKLFLNKKFDVIELDDLLENLMSYSLIDIKNEFANIHGIVQEIMRTEIEEKKETEKYVIEASKVILDSFPEEIRTQDNINSAVQIIDHAITVHKYLNSLRCSEKLKAEVAKVVGIALYNFGGLSNALTYLLDYIKFHKNMSLDINEEYGIVCERLGLTYHRIGESKEALKILLRAKDSLENSIYINCLSNILRSIGIIYKDIGEIDLALDYHKKALLIARDSNDRLLIINQLLNVGNIYRNKENYQKAELEYNEAERFLDDMESPSLLAKLYGNKGFMYKQVGRNEDALEYFKKALEIFRGMHDESSIAITLDHIGSVFIALGVEKNDIEVLKKSLGYYNEALELCVRNKNKWGEANTLLNIGVYYYYVNNKEAAIENIQKAKMLSEKIGHAKVKERAISILQDIL